MNELQLHASGFVVRSDGQIDDRTRARFLTFVTARGLTPTRGEAARALDDAVAQYRAGDALLVCDASPCAHVFDNSDERLAEMTARMGMALWRSIGGDWSSGCTVLLNRHAGKRCWRNDLTYRSSVTLW